jgi:heme exporter protein D
MTQTVRDYLLMSGYASFIWPAYGVAALILIGFTVDSWWRLHKATAEFRHQQAMVTKQINSTGASRKVGRQAGS